MIDLKATFGRKYRTSLDPSAAILDQSREDRLWLDRITCNYLHIFIHGRETLGAHTDRGRIATRLVEVPGVRVHQRGDHECAVVWPAANLDIFEKVAGLLKARKRPVLSEEERARRRERILCVRAGG